jgi:hypothetical protein
MRLLFHAPPFNTLARALYENLCALDGIEQSEYIRSLNQLINHLRTPIGISTLGIIWPSSRPELLELRAKGHLFRDMRIILILPDRHPDTISEGHLLRPRFVGFADGNHDDVVAVVAKLIRTRTEIDSHFKRPDLGRICLI